MLVLFLALSQQLKAMKSALITGTLAGTTFFGAFYHRHSVLVLGRRLLNLWKSLVRTAHQNETK